MTIRELKERCGFEEVSLPDPAAEIESAYASDLLSDVMAHCPDKAALVTVQNHKNTVAVCTLVGARVIVVVHARPIPDDMLEAAAREGVALLRTVDDQFTTSCRIGGVLSVHA